MTVASSTSRSDYTGNGVTTAFTGAFRILDQTHIVVYRTQISTGAVTTLALTTDYTVSGVGGTSFTVTCLVAPTSDQRISILRSVPLTQASSYPINDVFPSTTTENALDKLTMQVQQLNEAAGRALTVSPNSVGVSATLPSPSANQLIGWDATALALTNYSPTNLGINIYSAAWRTQTFNGNGVTTAFVLTQDAGVASNCDVSVAGVAQTADINYSYNSTTKTLTFLTGAPPSGTNNVVVRYGQALPTGTVAAANITDSTTTGRALITATDAAAVRSTISAAQSGANSDITSLAGLTSQVGLSPSILGGFRNLQASATGASANVSVSADELVVANTSNLYQTLRSVSLTINTAATGANGLDTGTLAAGTWYSVWVVWNGATTAGLISTSATAPTLPSGYTYRARVGWIRTDGTGNKYPLSFKQYGRRVKYVLAAGSNVLSYPQPWSGTQGSTTAGANTWAAVSVSSFVPSTASHIIVNAFGNGGFVRCAMHPNNLTQAFNMSGQQGGAAFLLNNNLTGSSYSCGSEIAMQLESTNIYAICDAAAGIGICTGWEDNL